MVDCIFDNAVGGIDNNVITVMHPQDYPLSANTYVLIGSQYFYEMKQQLIDLGYKNRQIIQTVTYTDAYAPEVTYGVFKKNVIELINAKRVYKRLVKNIDASGILFVDTTMSIGDIYFIIMYTKAYIKRYNITSYHYVITGNVTERMCRVCGINDYTRITNEDMRLLLKVKRFMEIPDNRVMICKPKAYTNLACNCEGYGAYDSFASLYKKSILPTKENMELKCPLPQYSNNIHKFFSDNMLKEGKTVLLAPYTQTLKSPSDTVWTWIAEKLYENGFSVCTNCVGKNEKPIRGTLPINLGFDEIIAFVETGGYFIGARSGLCDVISSSSAKIFIFYSMCMSNRFVSAAQYFSLHKIELTKSKNVREITWDSQESAEMAAKEVLLEILRIA